MSDANIQEAVKQKYGEAAKRAATGGTACCGGGAERSGCDPITKDLYDEAEKSSLPEKAVAASLGCGNPQRSRNCSRAKSFSILAPAAASMCSSRQDGWAPPAKPTAWT